MVPMIADDSFVPSIQDLATGNLLQGNAVTDNDVDLVEFGDCANPAASTNSTRLVR